MTNDNDRGRTKAVCRIIVHPATPDDEEGKPSKFLVAYNAEHPEKTVKVRCFAFDAANDPIPGAYFRIDMIREGVETGPACATFEVRAGEKCAEFEIPNTCNPDLNRYTMSVQASTAQEIDDSVCVAIAGFAPFRKTSDEVGGGDLALEFDLFGRRQAQMLDLFTKLTSSVEEQVQTSTGSLSVLQETLTAARAELVTTRDGENEHRRTLEKINGDLTNTIRMILTSFEEFSANQQNLIQNLETRRQVEWRDARDAAETRNRNFSETIDRQAEVLADHIAKLADLTMGVSQLDASVQQMIDKTGSLPKVCISLQNASEELKRLAANVKALEGLAELVAAAIGPILVEAVRPMNEELVSHGQTLTSLQTRLDAIEASQRAGSKALKEILSLHKTGVMPLIPSPEETREAAYDDANLAWDWLKIGGILILAFGVAYAILRL